MKARLAARRGPALLALLLCAACALAPRQADVLVGQAYQDHFQKGDFAGTVALCTQAIQEDPRQRYAYAIRGHAYFNLGDYTRAAGDFAHWVQAAPRDPDSHGWLALADFYLGRYQDSVAEYDKSLAIKEEPKNRASRAHALARSGRWAEAVADADKALAEAGTRDVEARGTAMGVRGIALALLRRDKEAAEAFDKLAAEQPARLNGEFLFFQGMAYADNGRKDQALAIAAKLTEEWPLYATRYTGDHTLEMFDVNGRWTAMASALDASRRAEAAGDPAASFRVLQENWPMQFPGTPQAEEMRQRMTALYPKLPVKPDLPEAARALIVQAKAHIKNQNEADPSGYWKALASYDSALNIAPWYPPVYFNAALVHAQLKRFDWAIRNMKVYLELAPDAPDARKARDKIYEWQASAKP